MSACTKCTIPHPHISLTGSMRSTISSMITAQPILRMRRPQRQHGSIQPGSIKLGSIKGREPRRADRISRTGRIPRMEHIRRESGVQEDGLRIRVP